MASRVWNSSGSTDMNDGANYTGSGALLVTDDLVFDNTSVINTTATGNLAVKSITVSSNYTGTFNDGGYVLSTSGAIAIDSGGAVTCTGTLTITGDSNFSFNCSGTATTSDCSIDLQGSSTFSNAKTSNQFKSLTCSASGKTTVYSISAVTYLLSITFGGGTFTLNTALRLNPTVDYTFNPGSTTISGTGSIIFTTSGAITLTINATTVTLDGSVQILSGTSGSSIVNLAGDLFASCSIYIFKNAIGAFTFNTNGYSLSTLSDLNIGNNNATGTFTFNAGSSDIACYSFTGTEFNTINNIVNLNTSSWTVKSNFIIGSNCTWNPGTASMSTTTNNVTITSNGKSLHDLTINNSGKTVDLNDALNLTGDLTVSAGTFDSDAFNVTIAGDVAINGTSTFEVLGSACTFGGDYTTATGTTITSTGATFAFTKDGAVLNTGGKALPQCTFNNNAVINNSCTIFRIIWGVDGKTLTFEAGKTFTISNLTASNWNGSAASLNALRSTTPDTQFTLAIPNAVTLTYMNPRDCIITGFEINVMDGTSVDGGNTFDWDFPPVNSVIAFIESAHGITGEIKVPTSFVNVLFTTEHNIIGNIIPLGIPDYIPNVTERAITLLKEQFKQSENFVNLLYSFIIPMQELEYLIYQIKNIRNLKRGESILDLNGLLVGAIRKAGQSDKDFRKDIQLKIFTSKSFGEPETLILFVNQLSEAQHVCFSEKYPASARISCITNYLPKSLLDNLNKIAPAGVAVDIQFVPNDNKYFGFSELNYNRHLQKVSGFSELNYSEYTEGGTLSELISDTASEIIL